MVVDSLSVFAQLPETQRQVFVTAKPHLLRTSERGVRFVLSTPVFARWKEGFRHGLDCNICTGHSISDDRVRLFLLPLVAGHKRIGACPEDGDQYSKRVAQS